MLVFLLKVAVPPVLVAVMSLAARRWGPTIGGLLLGIPWMTGPVLAFLSLDKGVPFAVGACVGIEFGVVCISAFMLAYGLATTFAPWPVCLAGAIAAFAAVAWGFQGVDAALIPAALAAAASLAVAYVLMPKPTTSAFPAVLPWWDIPMRMLATAVLVALIMLSADLMGPTLSGIVSTFPAMLTVIGTFTHHQWGRDPVRRVLRGLTLSLFGFVAFFVVVGFGLPVLGLALSYALAAAVAISISLALMALGLR
jgi:hypothetical protein